MLDAEVAGTSGWQGRCYDLAVELGRYKANCYIDGSLPWRRAHRGHSFDDKSVHLDSIDWSLWDVPGVDGESGELGYGEVVCRCEVWSASWIRYVLKREMVALTWVT